MPTVELIDEQMLKPGVGRSHLELSTEVTSLREVLSERIRAGILETGGRSYTFFVPSDAEAMLNSDSDLDTRVTRLLGEALSALALRRFVVLWDGVQVLDPDAKLKVEPTTKATFLRLVPLVGG